MKSFNKTGIVVLIVLLAVGFAAVTTGLIMNGSTSISANIPDFDVYFDSATTSNGSTATISQDKKTITFTGKDLSAPGQSITLDYSVFNASFNYDFDSQIEFNITSNSGIDYSDYFTVSKTGFEDDKSVLVRARKYAPGSITITLNKSRIGDDIDVEFILTISGNAVERDKLGSDLIEVSGYAYDEEGNILPNTPIIIFSNPVIVTTDENGHYEADLMPGEHNAYYIKGATEADLSAMGESIKTNPDAYIAGFDIRYTDDIYFNSLRIGDIYSIGSEEFYFIGMSGAQMKLFAKNGLDNENKQATLKTPYTYDFSESIDGSPYEDSIAKEVTDNYVEKLKGLNENVVDGRLLYYSELEELISFNGEMATVKNLQNYPGWKEWLNGNYFLMDIMLYPVIRNHGQITQYWAYKVENKTVGVIGPSDSSGNIRPVILVKVGS